MARGHKGRVRGGGRNKASGAVSLPTIDESEEGLGSGGRRKRDDDRPSDGGDEPVPQLDLHKILLDSGFIQYYEQNRQLYIAGLYALGLLTFSDINNINDPSTQFFDGSELIRYISKNSNKDNLYALRVIMYLRTITHPDDRSMYDRIRACTPEYWRDRLNYRMALKEAVQIIQAVSNEDERNNCLLALSLLPCDNCHVHCSLLFYLYGFTFKWGNNIFNPEMPLISVLTNLNGHAEWMSAFYCFDYQNCAHHARIRETIPAYWWVRWYSTWYSIWYSSGYINNFLPPQNNALEHAAETHRQNTAETHRQNTAETHRQNTAETHRQNTAETHRQNTAETHRQNTAETHRQNTAETHRQNTAETNHEESNVSDDFDGGVVGSAERILQEKGIEQHTLNELKKAGLLTEKVCFEILKAEDEKGYTGLKPIMDSLLNKHKQAKEAKAPIEEIKAILEGFQYSQEALEKLEEAHMFEDPNVQSLFTRYNVENPTQGVADGIDRQLRIFNDCLREMGVSHPKLVDRVRLNTEWDTIGRKMQVEGEAEGQEMQNLLGRWIERLVDESFDKRSEIVLWIKDLDNEIRQAIERSRTVHDNLEITTGGDPVTAKFETTKEYLINMATPILSGKWRVHRRGQSWADWFWELLGW